MPYVGNQPSGNFVQVTSQTITGNGGATYTLDRPAGNSAEIEVFVNHVRQDPASYSVTGTSLTLGGNVASTDSCYVVFQAAAVGTATHPATSNLQAADGTFSGDLTVDTNTLRVDSASNRLGVGTASPSTKIHLNESGSANAVQRVQAGTNGYAAQVHLYGNNVSGSAFNAVKSFVNGDSTPQWEITGPEASAEDVMTLHTGGSERMRIDASGRVTMPQQPAFWVDQTNSSQGVTSGSSLGGNTVIQFNGSRTNQGNHFANNRFTAPVSGLYQFSFNCVFDNTGSNVVRVFEMGFVKNNNIRFGHTSDLRQLPQQ